jgi:IS30 family transposase
VKIATLREHGDSIMSIATVIRRSLNTVAKELKDKKVHGLYIPKKAQTKTYWRRYRSKRDCRKWL